jgi:biotin carboxyl carrier protein
MKSYTITVNGNVYDVTVEETGSAPSAPIKPVATPVASKETAAPAPSTGGAKGNTSVTAPMPGKVLSINAQAGTAVKKGDTILVFEAMKMENSVVAPADGTVATIEFGVGDSFETGAVLATLN